jgi:hypothetical protein
MVRRRLLYGAALLAPTPAIFLEMGRESIGRLLPGDFFFLALLVSLLSTVLLALQQPKARRDWVGVALLAVWTTLLGLASYISCWAWGFDDTCAYLG